ncbi:MAG: MBL fold metallo-hydrolase [Rhodopseudomonas sp.]|nr:MBL fold metallo-hydrolase [Rhodopseudomonas sp.]
MMPMTRRALFASVAAAGAASALAPLGAGPARAEIAPTAGTGIYRYKVGSHDVIQLMDGARTFPMPDKFVANVSKDEAIKAAAAAYMPDGKVTIPFSPMVVNTGSKLVAIDTGNGLGAFAATKGAVGQARGNMAAAGIDPAKIDVVLISHFHGDHVGGLKNADGSPAFPNAEIKVPAGELAFWSDEANAAKANGFNKAQFPNVKKMMAGLKVTPYEPDKEVAPGITSVATPGHTPGHTSFVIASGSKKILVQIDVTNIPAMFLTHPDWHAAFDNDGDLAAATRHKIYDMAAAEKLTVVGYHFPYPCVGHVEKDGKGYRLVPVAWDPNG